MKSLALVVLFEIIFIILMYICIFLLQKDFLKKISYDDFLTLDKSINKSLFSLNGSFNIINNNFLLILSFSSFWISIFFSLCKINFVINYKNFSFLYIIFLYFKMFISIFLLFKIFNLKFLLKDRNYSIEKISNKYTIMKGFATKDGKYDDIIKEISLDNLNKKIYKKTNNILFFILFLLALISIEIILF